MLHQYVLPTGTPMSVSFETPDAAGRQLLFVDFELQRPEPLQAPAPGAEDWTPPELLKLAVQAATKALDRAHADGYVVPPQAAMGVAMLDTTALLLEGQVNPDADQRELRSRHAALHRDHPVTPMG